MSGAADVYDVVIAGGGPAGASCGTLCALGGLRTLVLEKDVFPRDKVCGDCVNPAVWRVLDELGVAERVLAAPHVRMRGVAIVGMDGERVRADLGGDERGEIGIARRVLDEILLRRCAEVGAEVMEGAAITRVERVAGAEDGWRLEVGGRVYAARRLVAADGRNSTVARLLGAGPRARRDRVGLQVHLPEAESSTDVERSGEIEMHLFREGYCGTAPVGGGLRSYTMVGTAGNLEGLKGAVCGKFGIDAGVEWRAIAPLERAGVGPYMDGVMYVGDAARVVEPFTGEGIYYALATGALAGRCLVSNRLEGYAAEHAALYRGRVWINRLARWAVKHPEGGAALVRVLRAWPGALGYLVGRVSGVSGRD